MTKKGAILLVEDEHDIRVSVRGILEDEGYEVLSAAHGKEALEVLRRVQPPPRLILLDLHMPVMDGWEFMALLQASTPLAALPVVCQTAVDRTPPDHITAFMRKPIDADALLAMVRHYCG
jgi:two-component system, OmpR family, response regulator CpxR